MKKKRLWLFGGLGFLFFGGVSLTACGILPTTPSHEPVPEPETQDKFVNTLFDMRYLNADFDINVKYQEEGNQDYDIYHVYGNALASMENLEKFAIDASFHLDMNKSDVSEKDKLPIFDFNIDYLDSTVYLDINSRRLKMKTDDLGTVIDLVMGEGTDSEEEDPDAEVTNLTSLGITDIVTNLASMTFEDKGEYYQYTSKTTGNQPDLIFTSDLDYKLKSISINGITWRDFTIDVNINTTILDGLDNPITSPETETNKYIDVSTYFGAMRKIRKILDEEVFGMNYHLELTHYEPATPDDKVYLGHTDGTVNMDLDKTIVELTGDIVINDPATETHNDYITKYRGQYFDECIYLDYHLNNGGSYKLAYSNSGLADLWDLLGDESVLGINIFDLIFGASDKEYPILDIISDAKYKDITKYGAINFTEDYIEVDVDNYLLGGKGHGSIKINLDTNDITSITISNLDINSYIVNGTLNFTDFVAIKKVNKLEYGSLDSLDKLIRSAAKYYRTPKFGLGLDVSITNEDNKELKLQGSAQLDLYKNLAGHMKLDVNDFNSRTHKLTLDSRLDNVDANTQVNNVYASYQYKVNSEDPGTNVYLKASYDSIYSIYQDVMSVINSDTASDTEKDKSAYEMIAPYISGATVNTVEKVMNGDYFALLRDETIKELKVAGNKYTIVLDKNAVGFIKDISIIMELDNAGALNSVTIATQYTNYDIKAKFTLSEYDDSVSYIDNTKDYYACDSFTDFAKYLANTSDNGHFRFMEQVSELMEKQEIGVTLSAVVRKDNKNVFTITNGRIDGKIRESELEDPKLLDTLDLVIQGTMNSNFNNIGQAQDHMDIKFGYKDDKLSLMLGSKVKLYCEKEDLNNIIASINELLNNNTLNGVMGMMQSGDGGDGLSIPLLTMFNAKDYQGLLSMVKGVSIEGTNLDYLKLTLSNELITQGDTSTFDLMVKIDTDGIKSMSVSGLKISGYELDVDLGLDEYIDQHLDPIGGEYLNIGNIKSVIDQVNDIITNKKLGLGLEFSYQGTDISGYAELNIPGKTYAVDFVVDGKEYVEETIHKRPYSHYRIENDGINCYLVYEDGTRSIGTGEAGADVITLDNDNTVRIKITEENLDAIITSIGNMASEDGYVKTYISKFIGNLANATGDQGEGEGGFDIMTLVYREVVKNMTYDEANNKLTVVLDGDEVGLESDATLIVTFDSTTHKITNIKGDTIVESQAAHVDLDLTEYDGNKHAIPDKTGTWVGADSLTQAVQYVETLNKEKALEKVSDQLDYLMSEDGRKAGLSYDINIGKKASTPLININGNLDVNLKHLDLTDFEKLDQIAIGVDGKITSKETGKTLNSTFDLRLVDGVAYFKYLHDENSSFRVQYNLQMLSQLKDMIYQEAETNPTLAQFINSLFPSDAADSTKTPFAKAMSTGNYIPLLQYFDSCYIDNGTLYIKLDGDVIDNEGYIEVGINANKEAGLKSISVKDFYAFGYYLSGDFYVDAAKTGEPLGYTAPVEPTDGTYVVLDDVNHVFTDIIELFSDEANKTVGYDLDVRYGDMLLTANADFILNSTYHSSEEDDFNDGTLKVKFSSGNKTHIIQADVNAKLYQNGTDYKNYQEQLSILYAIPKEDRTEADKANIEHYEKLSKAIVDAANDASVINLSYVDVPSTKDSQDRIDHGTRTDETYMYGTLTLGTIGDVYNVVQRVISGESSRFSNIMSMFSGEEGAKSVFSQILGGDIEAFLYNKIVKSVSYAGDTYTIVLNGDIFKVESTDQIEDVTLKLKLKNKTSTKKVIDYLEITGVYQNTNIEARLTSRTYEEPTKLVLPSSAYNFTSLEDVANVILNTAEQDDFVFSGTLTLDFGGLNTIASWLGVQNTPMPLDAKIHIETDPFGYENTTGLVSFTNVSEIPYLSEDTYKAGTRVFNIYIENVVQYYNVDTPYTDKKGNIIYDDDGNEIYYRPTLDADGEVVRDTNICLEVQYTKKNTSTIAVKRTRLSLDAFLNDLPYYLINYGLGIKTTVDETVVLVPLHLELNLHSTDEASTHVPQYSTILKAYGYNDSQIKWDATIDAKDLLGNDLVGDLGLTITGQDLNAGTTKDPYIVLKKLYGTIDVTDYMTAILDLDYKYYDDSGKINTIDPAILEDVHTYVQTYKNTVGYYTNLDTSEVSKGHVAIA